MFGLTLAIPLILHVLAASYHEVSIPGIASLQVHCSTLALGPTNVYTDPSTGNAWGSLAIWSDSSGVHIVSFRLADSEASPIGSLGGPSSHLVDRHEIQIDHRSGVGYSDYVECRTLYAGSALGFGGSNEIYVRATVKVGGKVFEIDHDVLTSGYYMAAFASANGDMARMLKSLHWKLAKAN